MVEARAAMAAAARVAGALDVAEAIIDYELTLNPDHPKTLETRAHLASRRKRWDQAWEALERLPEPLRFERSNLKLRFRVAVARNDVEAAEAQAAAQEAQQVRRRSCSAARWASRRQM